MNLPTFTHPWMLIPAGSLALLALLGGLWAQGRPGMGVHVVGQRPWSLGLGMALVFLGLGLGLAEPRYGRPEVPRLTVQVVLDASRSMLAQDAPEGLTRWQFARGLLERLWSEAPSSLSFGLDLLTGDSVPLLPPGEDRTLLREALAAVQPGTFGSPGTSLGRALPQIIQQVDHSRPTVILLISDGEETWEASPEALGRATKALQAAHLPLYALCVGRPEPAPLGATPEAPTSLTRAQPDFLRSLTEATGGKLLRPDEDWAALFDDVAQGRRPLPLPQSHQPAHPEWGAWLALLGLIVWLLGAGKPLRTWRVTLGLLGCWMGTPAHAELPWPPSIRAWMAERALERRDLAAAERWMPNDDRPHHRLLAAKIHLRAQRPRMALDVLGPLIGQGIQRPIPAWRAPALLLAARAHRDLGQAEEARVLLERLLREEPGRREAIHNLQTLIQDTPPKPKTPPPPPPRRSLDAQEDEREGFQQRLPSKQRPPAGVKDQ